ncbi:unnamed protein product [Paramecium sonneborni]|uniref:Uncharacterized protein n=1 Tax=Paramecium sonneborni TaxID=65129 RepID=A0A8S1JUZ8_9CILI|nr:unnamed protein product [Paramecium sonneborni]
MKTAVNSLQVSRSQPPTLMPVITTPVIVERGSNLQHSQIFTKDSPQQLRNEQQQLIELETRIQHLEQDSSPKLKHNNLIEENKKLKEQVRRQTESADKVKGELTIAKNEISKLKKVLEIQEEALTDIRIKNHSRNLSHSEKMKNDKLILQKEIMEQQHLKEKLQLQNQIIQLQLILEQQTTHCQNIPLLQIKQQSTISQIGQSYNLISKSQTSQQTSKSITLQENEQKQSSLNKISLVYSQDGDSNQIYYRPNIKDKLFQVPSKGLTKENSSPHYNNYSQPQLKFALSDDIANEKQEDNNIKSNFKTKKFYEMQSKLTANDQQKERNQIHRNSLSKITQQIGLDETTQKNQKIDKIFVQSPKYQSSNFSNNQYIQELQELKKEINLQKEEIQQQINKTIMLEQEKLNIIEKNEQLLFQFQKQVEEIKICESIKENNQFEIARFENKLESQKLYYESQIQDYQTKFKILQDQLEEKKLITEQLIQEKQNFYTLVDKQNEIQQIEEKQIEILNLTQKALNYKKKNDLYEIEINQLKQKEQNSSLEIEKIKIQFQDTQKILQETKDQLQIIQSQYKQELILREKLELNYAILSKEFSLYKENSFLLIDDFKTQLKQYQNKDIEIIQQENKNPSNQDRLEQDVIQSLIQSKIIIKQKNENMQLQQTKQYLEEEIMDFKNSLTNQAQLIHQTKQIQQQKFHITGSLKLDLSKIQLDEELVESNYQQQQEIDQIILENDSVPNIYDQVQTDRNQINKTLQQKDQELSIQKQQIEKLIIIHSEQKNQISNLKSELQSLEIITKEMKEQIKKQETDNQFHQKETIQQMQVELHDYDKRGITKNSSCLINQKIKQRDLEIRILNKSTQEIQQPTKNEVVSLQKKLQQQSEFIKKQNQELDKISLLYQNYQIEVQSNNLQIELQKSEYEQMKRHFHTIISQQKIVLEQKDKEILKIKQQLSNYEINKFDNDKLNQILIKSSEKQEIKKNEFIQDSMQQTNNELKQQLEKVQGENAGLQNVINGLQKENASLRDNNQKLIKKFEENYQLREYSGQLFQDNIHLRPNINLISQQNENFQPDYPKPGFISSKNKKFDEIEIENCAQQKEISSLRLIIRDLQNNQNYNINQNLERNISNHGQKLSQKKHLFDQNSIKSKNN